jgi:hypothetical protein
MIPLQLKRPSAKAIPSPQLDTHATKDLFIMDKLPDRFMFLSVGITST